LNIFFFKNMARQRFYFCMAIKTSHRPKFWGGGVVWEPKLFILFGLTERVLLFIQYYSSLQIIYVLDY
jgi:hypothetical protein